MKDGKSETDQEYFRTLDWQNLFAEDKKAVMDKIEPITLRNINYDKPICIIYNPNSGRRKNIILRIKDRLNSEDIPFKLLMTEKPFDTFLLANSLEIDKYSALIAVGGDGSCSEVVSGMLSRDDGKTLPFGCVPNGSGNYLCKELGIFDVDDALDTIVTACTAKFSVIECLADLENAADAPKGI
jgi:diacylglycerol kinase family enzyme